MPGETTPPTPEPGLDHTDAPIKAQIAKLQAAFADNLVEAFYVLISKSARAEEGSPLATLTLAQLDELLRCLHETVTQPPPDAPDTPEEGA